MLGLSLHLILEMLVRALIPLVNGRGELQLLEITFSLAISTVDFCTLLLVLEVRKVIFHVYSWFKFSL